MKVIENLKKLFDYTITFGDFFYHLIYRRSITAFAKGLASYPTLSTYHLKTLVHVTVDSKFLLVQGDEYHFMLANETDLDEECFQWKGGSFCSLDARKWNTDAYACCEAAIYFKKDDDACEIKETLAGDNGWNITVIDETNGVLHYAFPVLRNVSLHCEGSRGSNQTTMRLIGTGFLYADEDCVITGEARDIPMCQYWGYSKIL